MEFTEEEADWARVVCAGAYWMTDDPAEAIRNAAWVAAQREAYDAKWNPRRSLSARASAHREAHAKLPPAPTSREAPAAPHASTTTTTKGISMSYGTPSRHANGFDKREYMRATGRSERDLQEADELWAESGGVITDSHVRRLNDELCRASGQVPVAGGFIGMREVSRFARG